MPKYRKKPVVIEAIQWNGDITRTEYMDVWLESNNIQTRQVVYNADKSLSIETLEGVMLARPTDFIIQGVQGEIYPCRADIFVQTYEEEL